MSYETMRLDVQGGIAALTFTKAETGNPINGSFCRDLYDVAVDLSERGDVRAVLIRAEGRAFGYGGDIAGFLPRLDELPRLMKQWTGDFHTGILRLQRLDAPIVVAVHGVCAGGMVALAAGADFVLASDRARFVSAYSGIGLACDGGASLSLVHRMGRNHTRRFLILNEIWDAAAAAGAGLVDEVLEGDEALAARAEELAHRIAAGPTRAIGEIRRLLRLSGEVPAEAQMEAEAQAMARAAATADAREGITAFAQKRQPVFTGK